jgi:hypothetical protein
VSEIPPTPGRDRSTSPPSDMFAVLGAEGEGLLEYEVLSGELDQSGPHLPGGHDNAGEQIMTVNDGDQVELDENGLPPNKVNPDQPNEAHEAKTHRRPEKNEDLPDAPDQVDEDTQPAK